MSLIRTLTALALLVAFYAVIESADAQDKKKKDMSAPVRGPVTMVTAAESGEGGSIMVKTGNKKDKDAAVTILINKDTKIEKGGAGKVGTGGTAAKFKDIEKDCEVLVTMKEGQIGVADKVQILSGAKRKE
ncbi:MAG: hypothetical protein K2R98_11425 [Gemmataceae bacterium]|nr:hypothetical protein [Gemmataceae bacterium]